MMAVLLVFLIETLRTNQDLYEKEVFLESKNQSRGTEKVSLERTILDLGLDKHSTDALARVGIKKVGHLIDKLAEGEDAVLAITGFGQKSLVDAKNKLRGLGFEFPYMEKLPKN